MVNTVWEPGESRYTVLRWMENAEDDGYTLLGETEVRTARTGSTVTASQQDIDRAGIMADWFPDSKEYRDYYGFDYARCDDTVVTSDGKAVLNLYYDRELWTVNLHEEAKHESGTSDSLIPNDDIWYTATGKYGSSLPDDFPTLEELEKHYMDKTQFQDVKFLGVRDEFEAVSRHLDTFHFQDLAVGNHTFDAYPWLEHDAYPVYVTYLKESSDGTFRKVGMESAQVDKDPSVYGAEITVLHSKGLTSVGGWYTTGNLIEECEQKEKIPISVDQIRSDGKCVFWNVGSHLFVYLKRDTFTLSYIDGRSDGENVVYRTEEITYKDEITLDYEPEQGPEHKGDRFAGWYLSLALIASGYPLDVIRMPAGNVNVYAGWNPAEWSVTFDAQGGTESPGEQTVPDGEKAEMPEAPRKEGYIFAGWFTAHGGRDARWAWDFEQSVEEDMTLYAGWYPAGNTGYTVRHITEGEQEPFYEEEGTGNIGDIVFVRPLGPLDEGYPSDLYLESEAGGRMITLEETGCNSIVITYRKSEQNKDTDPDKNTDPDKDTEPDKNADPDKDTEPDKDSAPDRESYTEIYEITDPDSGGNEELTGGKGAAPATGDGTRTVRWLLIMAAALCALPGWKAVVFTGTK